MEKDFDGWNSVKKGLEKTEKRILFNEGEVWWMSVGINIGTEVCGKETKFKRPVLVFRKLSQDSFVGLPVTSLEKIGSWFVKITSGGRKRCILLNQIRMFDIKRMESRFFCPEQKRF